MEGREEFARFVCALPQITELYQKIEPINSTGGDGQNSLILSALKGRKRIILKVNLPWNDLYRNRAFEREYEIHSKLNGDEGIVAILGGLETIHLQVQAKLGGPSLPYVIQYFTMERARYDMADVIYSKTNKTSLIGRITLFRAACRSVQRFHRNGVCHRDLKPQNLLIFGNDSVKLGDLGTARLLGEGAPSLLSVYDFPRGDIRYTAPELICVSRECDEGFLDGDLYSLGAILFELCTSRVFSDVVYSLEYLKELAAAFSVMKADSREYVFEELLPGIIETHPLPRIAEVTRDIPGSVADRLDTLYRGLTEPRVKDRLRNFDEIFRYLENIIKILSWEEKSGKRYRS